jgi:hypothetical protein
MFTALTLSMALGAPVPTQSAPVPTGATPRLMELKSNADGKIMVTVTRTEMVKVPVAQGAAINPNGGAPPAVLEKEVPVTKQMVVELGEVKDLAVTTADGKKLEKEDALKKLSGGTIVVVSGDGKPVSPAFLKVFKDDTLVLASPELVAPQFPAFPGRGPGLQPLPLPANPGGIQVLPIQPGGVIQIQPGVIQVAPAVPVPPKPAPVEKPSEKN